MLILLRIVFGFLFVMEFKEAAANVPEPGVAGDPTPAYYLSTLLIIGLVNAVVWAPYLGGLVGGVISGPIVEGDYLARRNRLHRLLISCDHRGWRRITLAFAFLEGIHEPDQPLAFYLGMRNARPGSWLQRLFAREVYRFDNVQHCLEACRILQHSGASPTPHRLGEVNIAIAAQHRQAAPDRAPLPVPPAPRPETRKRDRRIQLFEPTYPAPPPELPSDPASEAASPEPIQPSPAP